MAYIEDGSSKLTLFEYLAAGFSLILSFALLRALSGVPHAVHSGRRYWVHVFWLLNALVNCLFTFWAFWSYREVEWTLIRFSATLAIPALLYVYNSLLVPPDPASVDSWRDHFFSVRIPLFSTGMILSADIGVTNFFVLGFPLLASWPVFAMVAIYAIGLASARSSVHAILPLGYACMVALSFLVLDPPGSLTRVFP